MGDTAGSSTAGVVPTPALQSPTLANQQLQLPQQPPQQPLVMKPPQQPPVMKPPQQPLVMTPPQQLLVMKPQQQPLVIHLEKLAQPAVKLQLALLQPLVLRLLLNNVLA